MNNRNETQRSPDSYTMATSIPIPRAASTATPYANSNSNGNHPSNGNSNNFGGDSRSPRSLISPSSARSPGSSLSTHSHRSHPYPRRHSLSQQPLQQQQQQQAGPSDARILLPPPNSAAPLHVLHERDYEYDRDDRERERDRDHRDYIARERERDRDRDLRERDRDPRDRDPGLTPLLSTLGVASPPNTWRERPGLARTNSSNDGRFSNERGVLSLPPFSSISASSSSSSPSQLQSGLPTPNGLSNSVLGLGALGPPAPNGSMGPPAHPSPGNSRPPSPKPFGLGGLRPSYYDPTPSRVLPIGLGVTTSSVNSGGPQSASGAACYRRDDLSPQRYAAPDRTSPPRGTQTSQSQTQAQTQSHALAHAHAQAQAHAQAHVYSPERYMHPALPTGRSRSHSAASAMSRYGGAPSASSSDGGEWGTPGTPQNGVVGGGVPVTGSGGGGQSRRLAHLMSEQKRRESINTGFQALRAALPQSIATDSKAIILRKAVNHITHLETLLRKAGMTISPLSTRADSANTTIDGDGDEELVEVGAVMRMGNATGSAAGRVVIGSGAAEGDVDMVDIKMDKAGWEDVQVEDIQVDRKRSV